MTAKRNIRCWSVKSLGAQGALKFGSWAQMLDHLAVFKSSIPQYFSIAIMITHGRHQKTRYGPGMGRTSRRNCDALYWEELATQASYGRISQERVWANVSYLFGCMRRKHVWCTYNTSLHNTDRDFSAPASTAPDSRSGDWRSSESQGRDLRGKSRRSQLRG